MFRRAMTTYSLSALSGEMHFPVWNSIHIQHFQRMFLSEVFGRNIFMKPGRNQVMRTWPGRFSWPVEAGVLIPQGVTEPFGPAVRQTQV